MEELKKEALSFLAGKWNRKEKDRNNKKKKRQRLLIFLPKMWSSFDFPPHALLQGKSKEKWKGKSPQIVASVAHAVSGVARKSHKWGHY